MSVLKRRPKGEKERSALSAMVGSRVSVKLRDGRTVEGVLKSAGQDEMILAIGGSTLVVFKQAVDAVQPI